MGFFKNLAKIGFDTVTAPIEVVKDVGTFGGLNTDQEEPYTMQRLRKLAEDIEDTRDSLDD